MQTKTFETWVSDVEILFIERGRSFPSWLSDDDIYDNYVKGLTPAQFYDRYVVGWFF